MEQPLTYTCSFFFFFPRFFELGSHYVAQADFQLTVLLPQLLSVGILGRNNHSQPHALKLFPITGVTNTLSSLATYVVVSLKMFTCFFFVNT
jgi:hypothetical protein